MLVWPEPIDPGPPIFLRQPGYHHERDLWCVLPITRRQTVVLTLDDYVGPKSSLHPHQDGVEGVTGAQFADGEAECIKAVRKQVGAGADWIKVASILPTRSGNTDI